MADAKLTALTAASALAAADLFYVSQSAASRKATGTQLLTLVGTTYVPLAGGTMTGALTIASGTLTASAPALNITQTWNDWGDVCRDERHQRAAMRFKQIADNFIEQWRVCDKYGGQQRSFRVDFATAGSWSANGSFRTIDRWSSTRICCSTETQPPRLRRETARRSKIFRLYNTTDAGLTNYERLTLTGVAGTSVNITAETLGTGGDNLDIVLTPAGTGKVRLPDGLSTQLALTFTTTATTGIFAAVSGTRIRNRSNGTFSLNVASNFVAMPTASVLGWTSVGGADGSSIAAGLATTQPASSKSTTAPLALTAT
jgi:hypothetical protein